MFKEMRSEPIYFEKYLDYDSKKLIEASELRRKVLQSIQHGNNGFVNCLKYYTLLCEFMHRDTKMKSNILFIWNDNNSTCFQFEKLHVLELLSHWAHDLAIDKGPKEAKQWFSKAVSYELEAINTIRVYNWMDPSNTILPIMQDRYHLAKALIYASDFYFNMYTFKEVLFPVKKSYQLIELASRIWKKMDYEQMKVRHALTLKHMAEGLQDEQCGERVALMETALQLYENEELKKIYNLWRQQNESVYYNTVETKLGITCLSLKESLPNLLTVAKAH